MSVSDCLDWTEVGKLTLKVVIPFHLLGPCLDWHSFTMSLLSLFEPVKELNQVVELIYSKLYVHWGHLIY